MDDVQIAKIQGFLKALEDINQFSNHSANFFFGPIGSTVDPRGQLSEFTLRSFGVVVSSDNWSLEPISDWKSWIGQSATHHLLAFAFGGFRSFFTSDEELAKRRSELAGRLPVSDVVHSFLELLGSVIGDSPAVVSVVSGATGAGLPDAIWDAYLIQSDDRLLLLWLGWSD